MRSSWLTSEVVSAARTFVQAFVSPSRQQRYLALLESTKGQEKFRLQLAHFHDFDSRFVLPVKASEQSPEAVGAFLRKLGAPESCIVISELDEIHGKKIDLNIALSRVLGSGMGSILCCLQGILAFYEGEERNDRFVLRRAPGRRG